MCRVTTPSDHVVVVGAGASALVLALLVRGFTAVTAVDISPGALAQLAAQLGDRADAVTFVEADVRRVTFDRPVDLWHDRATFHFLTSTDDQEKYVEQAAAAVRAGGHLVLAQFAPSGPEQCSGQPVARHTVSQLTDLFGGSFDLVETFERDHLTPWGSTQTFTHALFRRNATSP